MTYPESFNGKIYLTTKNRWFILDEFGNFHPIIQNRFKCTSEAYHNVFDIQGTNITNEVECNAESSFFDFLLHYNLYTLIDDDKIDNLIY